MNSPILASASQSTQPIWLTLGRLFQVLIICVAIGLFIMSIPANYEARSKVCRAELCPPDQFTAKTEQALAQIGMTVDSFAKMTIGLDTLVAAIFTISAIVIFIRKPNDLFTIFVTVMLVTFGLATFSGGIKGIGIAVPSLHLVTETLALIGNCSIVAFLFIFPNGRFTPRWTFALLVGWVLFQLPRYYWPDSPLNLSVSSPSLYNLLFPLGILSGIVAQVYRYRRISNTLEQQQTKWVIYGLVVGISGYLIARLISMSDPDPYGNGLLLQIALNFIAILFILLIPLSITIAVIRYRLWNINPIINRTLVYGALSACTIAFYIFAVGFFSNFFQQRNANVIISFLATGVIAFLFEPLREDLQRIVNRLMYGERDDPATVLTRLSQRLESAVAPDSVLQTIVETLGQTLRLPYAAIAFFLEEHPRTIAEFGRSPSEVIHFPLTYQSERVGELILAPRAPGESFSPADIKLINIIAHQAGSAAYTVRLNHDLQHSRERLVTAQEEERRRLRRDLHDGIGPTLASLSQRLDNAADLVHSDPEKSIQLLKDLKGQVKGTLAEIRRLVYALRPPVLDEFGLVSAIREHVAQYTGPNGLSIAFDCTEPMPPLPAAVEVAAYRIVLEAFTNIVHHAEASRCTIKLKLYDHSLFLEVADDGKGLSDRNHAGLGLTSMRERAAELGGQYFVENIRSGGTRVCARLPIEKR